MEKQFSQDRSKLCIKHMVCPRCIYVVKTELERLSIPFLAIRLGEVDLDSPLTEVQHQQVKSALEQFGFQLIEDQKEKVIDQIKTLILQMVRYTTEPVLVKYSEYLAREIGKDYSLLSNLFSGSENITIEKYIILQKIEYVKELLTYGDLSLGQIATKLSYCDVGYLSRQFKEITGSTPTEYRKQSNKNRKALNELVLT